MLREGKSFVRLRRGGMRCKDGVMGRPDSLGLEARWMEERRIEEERNRGDRWRERQRSW